MCSVYGPDHSSPCKLDIQFSKMDRPVCMLIIVWKQFALRRYKRVHICVNACICVCQRMSVCVGLWVSMSLSACLWVSVHMCR